jgi:hypothetical protein
LSLPAIERHPAGKSEGQDRDGRARNVLEGEKELMHGETDSEISISQAI